MGRARLSIVLAMLACALDARAQINTEPLRKKLKTKGWSFTVQGSLDAHSGNTRGVDASGGGGIGVTNGPHTAFVFGNAEFARYSDATAIDNSFLHARYNYAIEPWLWGELFGQLQSDRFQRILLRDLAGVGPRFGLYQSKDFDVYYGTGWIFEHDAISPIAGSNDRLEYFAQRWNNYVSVSYAFDTRATVASTLYYEPQWTAFSNFRVLEETALTFKITKQFTASVVGNYHYDSRPPAGALSTDLEIKNVLAVIY